MNHAQPVVAVEVRGGGVSPQIPVVSMHSYQCLWCEEVVLRGCRNVKKRL
jgi:hypothetical protein